MPVNRGVIDGLKRPPMPAPVRRVYPVESAGSTLTVPSPDLVHKVRAGLTANCTVTVPSPLMGQELDISFVQDASGFRDVTWKVDGRGTIAWSNSITPVVLHKAGTLSRVLLSCTTDGVWDGVGLFDSVGFLEHFALGDGAVASSTVYKQRDRTFSYGIELMGVSGTTGFGFGPTGQDLILDLVLGSGATSVWPSTTKPTIVAGTEETAAEVVPDTRLVDSGTSVRAAVVQAGAAGHEGTFVVENVRWRWAG